MALIVAAAGLLPFAAQAQGISMEEAQARYKEDMQRCATIADPESQRTCRREAGAALQEARRDRLVRGNVDPSTNITDRCQRLPAGQQADCERLMRDSSAVERGSVSGGGVLRELTITVPAESVTGTTGTTGTYTQPAQPGTSGAYTQPAQPATGGTYTQPAQPATGGTYTQPAPSGTYTQPAQPAPGAYGTQPR